jgi:nucleoside-diphosphate-sugar epimerase
VRIVITGAGGFVGRALISRLIDHRHDIIAIDRELAARDGVEAIAGDLCDPAVLDRAFSGGCDAVVHLATMPGGAAELDPAGARRTNVEASMMLTEAAARSGRRPKFVFASSIAVFGAPLPKQGVDDATPLAPRMLYGAHKAMIEQWVATLSRRGEIDGLSLRLPGIVARPAAASGMKSAFMSNVFHALRAGRAFISPVSATATMWLMSVDCVAAALCHALEQAAPVPDSCAVTLPALHVRMHDLVAEIAHQCGADPQLVGYAPDPALEAAFGAQPPLSTDLADRLGFVHDGTLEQLVASALRTLDVNEGTII